MGISQALLNAPVMGGGVVSYPILATLLDDNFTTSDGTGSRTRVCEPTGSIVITDASGISSIAGGRLIFSGTPAATSGFIGAATYARVAGRAMRVNYARVVAAGLHRAGWGASLSSTLAGTLWSAPVAWKNIEGAGVIATPAVPLAMWVILRATGYFIASDTKLLYIASTGNGTNITPVVWLAAGQATDFDLDRLSVFDLGGDWAVDGPKISSVASPATGATAASRANGMVEITWAAGAGETLSIFFRTQDSDNGWVVKADQAAGKIYLYERVGGGETERGATGGVAVTLNAGTSYRLLVRFDGADIRTYVDGLNKNTYLTATTFLTATAISVSGFASATNFIVWKVDI